MKKLIMLTMGLLGGIQCLGMDDAVVSTSTEMLDQDKLNHELIIAINHQDIPAINSALKNGANINAAIPKKYAKNHVDLSRDSIEYKLTNNIPLSWKQSEQMANVFSTENLEWVELDGVKGILEELVFANNFERVSLLGDPVKYLLPTECVLSTNELTAQKAARAAALRFLPLCKKTASAVFSALHVNNTSEGITPLTWAILVIDQVNEDTKIVSLIINAGADVNARIKKPNYAAHFSPLMLAIEKGAVETMLLLRSNKAKKGLLDTDILASYTNKIRDIEDALKAIQKNESRLRIATMMQKGFLDEGLKLNMISETNFSEANSFMNDEDNTEEFSTQNISPLNGEHIISEEDSSKEDADEVDETPSDCNLL